MIQMWTERVDTVSVLLNLTPDVAIESQVPGHNEQHVLVEGVHFFNQKAKTDVFYIDRGRSSAVVQLVTKVMFDDDRNSWAIVIPSISYTLECPTMSDAFVIAAAIAREG